MAAESNDTRSPPVLLPKHTIFLSHSGRDSKEFVGFLNDALERAHYSPFFDQNSDSLPMGQKFPGLIDEAARQCLVAVIVLSSGYLESKWPMKELLACVESMNHENPIKLLPLFYKLSPEDLKRPAWRNDWRKIFGGDEEAKCLEAIKELKEHNGLQFSKYGNAVVKYVQDVVAEIGKLLPRPLPYDTSEIQGCDRLCEYISSQFIERDGIQYLGLYGISGSGKSKLCCEAMCNYFNEDFHGRFCIVELESDKSADSKVAIKKREDRLRLAIKQTVGLNKNMSTITSEAQGRKYLKDRVHHQRVFLVLDNVSLSSLEEAEFYVKAGFAQGSKVLVTSRSKNILESLLGGSRYCQPVPVLKDVEAAKLVLSRAARSRFDVCFEPDGLSLEPDELQILRECVERCYIDQQYHPSSLRALANYLKNSAEGDILSWTSRLDEQFSGSSDAGDIFRFVLLEYEALEKQSKLIFLDLAIFAEGMCYTHMDFHRDLEWDEHSNFTNVVTYIHHLHNISFQTARYKVKDLQRKSFLKESDTEISVPDFYREFAFWLIRGDGDREEKEWCMICEPEEEERGQMNTFANLPDGSSKMVRVRLMFVSVRDSDISTVRQWGNVAFLELVAVETLPILDLQGFRSLRVLKVEECEDLERIVCSCTSLSSGGQLCSGCLPNLRVVQLVMLENLKYASFPEHCRNLETLWFFDCPNLSRLPDLRNCIRLKRLRLPCGDFQDFHCLSSNQELTELAFHWARDHVRNFSEDMQKTLLHDVMNLTNLTVLDIVDEREVFEWIPPGFRLSVGKLVHLSFLDLSCATTIEEVEGLECLTHLTSLGLYGCCELRKLPLLSIFKTLKRLCIGHCHKLALLDNDQLEKVEDFHPTGDVCNFGEHECLDPHDKLKGICKTCQPDEWDEINGDQPPPASTVERAPQEPNVVRTPVPNVVGAVQESYLVRPPPLSKDMEARQEPGKNVDIRPQRAFFESSSEKAAAPKKDSVSVSEKEVHSAHPAAQMGDAASNKSLNILLLGETGVGKSTFINALCNYLKYSTLDEARDGEMESLIYSEFTTSTDNEEEIKIVVGKPTDDEGGSSKSVGSSCTQNCKAYKFAIGRTLIRLVDTPGIGDTRGFDQDMKNIKDIISFISRYEVLNAICILLKPDQERLTISLRYCIVELLAHLHKDAASNILFCFTNSRSTMFRVGGTKNLLKDLLAQKPETAVIKLDKDTMYHFDSEGFRFLASVRNGLNFDDDETEMFRRSWRKSTHEASRLMKHVASLTPHDIQSTLSLNRVRDMLTAIETPLAAISAAIQNNLDENRRVISELLESHGDVADKYKHLIIKESVEEMAPLEHPRTICNASRCKGKTCHDLCSPHETIMAMAGYFTGDKYIFCEKISLRSGKCRTCGCLRESHLRVSHEPRIVVREREDESIRKVIDDTQDEIQKKKAIAVILEEREKSYKGEMEVVVNAAALFAGFLSQNSIITYHAATQEYLREQIKRKKYSNDHNTSKGKARIQELEGLLETYERQVDNFRTRTGPRSGMTVTIEDVKSHLNMLYGLPRSGESLRMLMDTVEREYKMAAVRRDEVSVNMPTVPINQGASANSLLKELSVLTINTDKNAGNF